MSTVSIYNNIKASPNNKTLSLDQVLNQIKEGRYRDQIEACRSKITSLDKSEYIIAKEKLPAFTPSGIFKIKRRADKLMKYSQYIVLDIDNLESIEKAIEIRIKASSYPYTKAAFLSPSALGVKIIVLVQNGQLEHKAAFVILKKWYEVQLNVLVDDSGSDISRLCLFSYDPDLFNNLNAEAFDHTKYTINFPVMEKAPSQTVNNTLKAEQLFINAIKFTENKRKFELGSRNNFILLLAGNMNRFAIAENTALQMITEKYESSDFSESEIKATVNSAYRNNADFGKYAFEIDDTPKKQKIIKKTDIEEVCREHGIKIQETSDTWLLSILLHSCIYEKYESLHSFCMDNLLEFLPVIALEEYKQIISEISSRQIGDEGYWLTHENGNIRSFANITFQNTLEEREEVIRIRVCLHRIYLLNKLLHRKILESRFIPANEIAHFLGKTNELYSKKAYWQKELECLASHLLNNAF